VGRVDSGGHDEGIRRKESLRVPVMFVSDRSDVGMLPCCDINISFCSDLRGLEQDERWGLHLTLSFGRETLNQGVIERL
jgi:hypothetical protein